MTGNTYNFEAETSEILKLLTHSIYTNKEIFLRELISNSSDAIDKARIKSLTDTAYLGDDTDFQIKIDIDKKNNLLILTDNGIGMTKDELVANIGTIAKSGTKDFLSKLKEKQENNLIGQFGVGFYSVFMVADKVEFETKSNDDKKAYKWISEGKDSYEIVDSDKASRGTMIKIYLNDESKDFLEYHKIRTLIYKYSNYIQTPIMMLEQETEENKDKEKKYEQINETKSIWSKNTSEVTDEEYQGYYQSVSMDFQPYFEKLHLSLEGMINYKTLLFIPLEKPMMQPQNDQEYGPKLYIQNVLILDHAKELLPVWLRFMNGVVETNDIPLNISRELVQSNQVIEKIKKGLVKKILDKLEYLMKNDSENYDKFLINFGNYLKEGVHFEFEQKEKIAGLLKYDSFLNGKKISLDEYIEAKKDDKKNIYFITGKSKSEILSSPYLNQFKEKNIDVLLMDEPIDEWVIQALPAYKEFNLINITDSNLEIEEKSEEDKKKEQEEIKENKDLLDFIKKIIGEDKLEDVKLSKRLGDNVSALATTAGGNSPQMEKIMKAMGQMVPPTKRIFEINPENSIFQKISEEFNKDKDSDKLKDLVLYSYEQALLAEGGEIENMQEFLKRLNKFAENY